MRHHVARLCVLVGLAGFLPSTAAAQDRPAPIVEAVTGWAGFVDENWIDRTMIGGGGRVFVTRRVAIGPEFVFLRGTNDEHDWTLTVNATVDLIPDDPSVPRRVVPYLAVGGGYLRQTTQVGTGPFTSGEGTVSGGIGVRVSVGRRFFVAPEFRVGYEPELRFGLTFGIK